MLTRLRRQMENGWNFAIRTAAQMGGPMIGLIVDPLFPEANDVVPGGSIPTTNLFAAVGIGSQTVIPDHPKIADDAGGVKSRGIRFSSEDTACTADTSAVGLVKIIAQDKPNLCDGDGTGFSGTNNPELECSGGIMKGERNRGYGMRIGGS